MSQANSTRETAIRTGAELRAPPDPVLERLDAIEDQGRQTLELIRSLIGIMLPSTGREGPPLEDLIATVIVQQRDAAALLHAVHKNVGQIAEHLGVAADPDVGTHGHLNGGRS